MAYIVFNGQLQDLSKCIDRVLPSHRISLHIANMIVCCDHYPERILWNFVQALASVTQQSLLSSRTHMHCPQLVEFAGPGHHANFPPFSKVTTRIPECVVVLTAAMVAAT